MKLNNLRPRYISKVQMKAVFGMIPEHDQQALFGVKGLLGK
jgi:hypothetical protein